MESRTGASASGGVAIVSLKGQAGAATEAVGMAAPPATVGEGCEGFCATESHFSLEPLPHAPALVPSWGDVNQVTISGGQAAAHPSQGQVSSFHLGQESTPITAHSGGVNGCTPDVTQEVAQGSVQTYRQERESANGGKRRRGRGRFRHRKNPRLWKQQGSGRDLVQQGSSDIMVEKGTPTEKAEPQGRGSGWCFLCHINCVTAEILKQHLAGKKHKRNLAKQNLEHAETPQMDSYSEVEPKADAPDKILQDDSTIGVMQQVITESTEMKQGEDLNSVIAAVMSLAEYKKKMKRELDEKQEPKKRVRDVAFVNGTDTSSSEEMVQKKSKLLEKCEVCNITCTSRSLLESHMAGRKHAARIHRLEKRDPLLKSNDENTIKGSVPGSFGIDGSKQTGNEDASMIAVDRPVTAEIVGEIATDTMKELIETCGKIEDACGTML